MNLIWVAGIAIYVIREKMLPAGPWLSPRSWLKEGQLIKAIVIVIEDHVPGHVRMLT